MINRQDLVDKFEVITKQEIKNHNDAILATNIAINRLEEKINEIVIYFDKRLNGIINENSNKNFRIDEKFEHQLLFFKELKKEITNIRINIKEFNEKLINEISEKVNKKENNIEFKRLKEVLERQIETTNEKISQERLLTITDNKIVRNDIVETVKVITNYMQMQEAICDELVISIEQKSDLFKLEKDSLMKEINILKKESFITEKKIENIYTLIDRLQKP